MSARSKAYQTRSGDRMMGHQARTTTGRGGTHYAVCSCGYVSWSYAAEHAAETMRRAHLAGVAILAGVDQ